MNLYKKDANIILFKPSDGDDIIQVNINHKEQGHKKYDWMEFQPELESLGFHGVNNYDECYYNNHTDIDKLKKELSNKGFRVTVY